MSLAVACPGRCVWAKKALRKAAMPRCTMASTMRKMHVPAYWPVLDGVQAVEKSGVMRE